MHIFNKPHIRMYNLIKKNKIMDKLQHMLAEAVNDVTIPTHRKYNGNMDSFLDAGDYEIMRLMLKSRISFLQPINMNDNQYLGWKYTIVANTMEDYLWLYVQIGSYLRRIEQPFKVGTSKLLNSNDKEQSVKCITIYITKKTNVEYLLDDLKHFLRGYNPNIKLKYSEHVWGPIWKRQDRDEYGSYIPADPNKHIK